MFSFSSQTDRVIYIKKSKGRYPARPCHTSSCSRSLRRPSASHPEGSSEYRPAFTSPSTRKRGNARLGNHGPIIRENCASHEINAPRTALNKKNAPESASTLYVRHLRHPRSRHLGERHVAHRRRAGLGEAAPAVEAAGGTGVGGVRQRCGAGSPST